MEKIIIINFVLKRAVVTASKSRKKHQQEKIYKALEADQLNKKIARENYFFTNLGYLQYASFEPFLFQSKEEPEEGTYSNLTLFYTLSIALKDLYSTKHLVLNNKVNSYSIEIKNPHFPFNISHDLIKNTIINIQHSNK